MHLVENDDSIIRKNVPACFLYRTSTVACYQGDISSFERPDNFDVLDAKECFASELPMKTDNRILN